MYNILDLVLYDIIISFVYNVRTSYVATLGVVDLHVSADDLYHTTTWTLIELRGCRPFYSGPSDSKNRRGKEFRAPGVRRSIPRYDKIND